MVSLSQAYGDPIIAVPQSEFMIVVYAPTRSLTGSRQNFQRILLASRSVGCLHLAQSGHPTVARQCLLKADIARSHLNVRV
jgi:hypothetical protein